MDQKPNLPEQSRQAFERAYAAIPAITPTKETAWQIWNAALSAPPAQEPVAYIDPMKFAALRRFTDRGGVLTTITPHRAFPDDVALYASPLPQEPQEGKELTDADAGLTAAWKVLHDETIPASNRYIRAIKAYREATGALLKESKDAVDDLQSGRVRPPSWREVRVAQEAKAGECVSVQDEVLAALRGAEEWLSGWASAEPYLSRIRAAIARATGAKP